MKILGHGNGNKIHKTLPLSTQILTYFTANVHGSWAVKTRPSMKILGHGNGTKIHKT